MLWVLPGGRDALVAGAPQEPWLPPELREGSGAKLIGKFVRDLPVDFTILLENIADPDHGSFAHQTGRLDLNSGSAEHPQRVRPVALDPAEAGPRPWSVQMGTDAVPKMTARVGTAAPQPVAAAEAGVKDENTITYTAPCLLASKRSTGPPIRVFFYVVPTGVGHSRLFIAWASGVDCNWTVGPNSKMAVPSLPRWITTVMINRFLDQDNHLLATQQPTVLAAEFAARAEGVAFRRVKYYNHRSLGDKLLMAVEGFHDASAPAVPGRYSQLIPGIPARTASAFARRAFAPPPRSVTLDRFQQSTAITPDHLRVFEHLGVVAMGLGAAAALLALVAATRETMGDALTPAATAATSAAVAGGCVALRREFCFATTEANRDEDLANVPQVYPDVW